MLGDGCYTLCFVLAGLIGTTSVQALSLTGLTDRSKLSCGGWDSHSRDEEKEVLKKACDLPKAAVLF